MLPAGWRPEDVRERYPIVKLDDPHNLEKYAPKHRPLLPAWSWLQLSIGLLFVGYLFAASGRIGAPGVCFHGDWFGISGYAPSARYLLVGYLTLSSLVAAFFWLALKHQARGGLKDRERPAPDSAVTEGT